MKAINKYGSTYQATASSQAARLVHRRPMAPRQVPDAVAINAAIKLPHERDESVDQGGGGKVASESVAQAGRDVKGGLLDTDRGVEMHHTYQKQKIRSS